MLNFAYAALSVVLFSTALALYGLLSAEQTHTLSSVLTDPYLQTVLQFSLKQALWSTLLSVLLALPVARALYYSPRLWGRAPFLSLCLLSFVTPTLVLVTGLVALLGRNGWLSPYLGADWNLYGLKGILIAHVYLNLPFALRLLLQQLQAIPDSAWRLGRQLKFSAWQRFYYIEWPMLRGRMWHISGLIFVLCFNSFAVVLALGGGPQATTLEVAMYQALKYDFNMSEALMLAWLQWLVAGGVFLLVLGIGKERWLAPDTATRFYTPVPSRGGRYWNVALYGLLWILLLLPIVALVGRALELTPARWQAMSLALPLWRSIGLATVSAALALGLAYALLGGVRLAKRQQKARLALLWSWLSMHGLLVPTLVLAVGWYVFIVPRFDLEHWQLYCLWLLNTLVIVPFAIQQLQGALLQYDTQYQRLVASLKLNAWQRMSVEWQYIRPNLWVAGVLVWLLALGDVAIFALFGPSDWLTLPWLIYQYASSYRLPEAACAALVLWGVCALSVGYLEGTSKY